MNTRRRQILKELNLYRYGSRNQPRKQDQSLESQSIEIRNLISPPDPAKDSQQRQEIHQMRLGSTQISGIPVYCLLAYYTKHVLKPCGVGDENADWLFVGEGPGATEDATGEPFCWPGRQTTRSNVGSY